MFSYSCSFWTAWANYFSIPFIYYLMLTILLCSSSTCFSYSIMIDCYLWILDLIDSIWDLASWHLQPMADIFSSFCLAFPVNYLILPAKLDIRSSWSIYYEFLRVRACLWSLIDSSKSLYLFIMVLYAWFCSAYKDDQNYSSHLVWNWSWWAWLKA